MKTIKTDRVGCGVRLTVSWVVVLLAGVRLSAIDPVTAGAASGLAVELLKGIATSIKGDDVAQVQVRAKTDGPDGDDKAFAGETDKDNLFFEYYLDAEAKAEAAQVDHHLAWGELHYAFTEGAGWRPNNVAPVNGKEWWGVAIAYPDSTPVAGSNNKTEAAVVGAFSWNGSIEFGGYIDQSHQVVEVPKSPKVQATNAVLLRFDVSQFVLATDPGDPSKMSIQTRDPSLDRIDLFHNYAGFSQHDYFTSNFAGFNSYTEALEGGIASDFATVAGLVPAGPGARAELTFGSAAIEFNNVVLDRYKLVGGVLDEKTQGELLQEYFDQLWIGATANSQIGYTPNVLGRTTLLSGMSVPIGPLESDLAARLNPTFDGEIGLFFYVDSFLEDAVNLAAATQGTALNQFFSGLNPGDTFDITLSYGTGETFAHTHENVAAVPEFSTSVGMLGFGALVLFAGIRRARMKTLTQAAA